MKKLVTMKDIAEQLNVSIVTVSKALSGKDGVGAPLRSRILQMAGEMNYLYPSKVQEPWGESVTVGVLVAHRFFHSNNSFYWHMYQNIAQQFAKRNSLAILEEVSYDEEDNLVLPNLIKARRIDAVIVLGQMSRPYIKTLMEAKQPMLFLDFYDPELEVDAVVTDNALGSYLLTRSLIHNGHKHIGFVGSIHTTPSILDRYIGYYKALVENMLPVRWEWVLPDRDEKGKVYETFELPAEMPTAFVCNCDEMAYHFLQHLNAKGYQVPEDVSLVGFDNYLFSTIANPQLTTMAVNIPKMSEIAAECIFEKLRNANATFGCQSVRGSIVYRDSVKKL